MKDFSISYTNATVTHSTKYNQGSGFFIYHVFFSNLLQDAVFTLDESGEEFPSTYKNLNLLLYPGQKVSLVSIEDNVIAYIDKATGNFYYLTNNLQRDLPYGLPINWHVILPFAILGFIVSTYYDYNDIFKGIIFGSLFILWFYQRIMNFILERKIDKLIVNK
jgi:hypothetical protein